MKTYQAPKSIIIRTTIENHLLAGTTNQPVTFNICDTADPDAALAPGRQSTPTDD